MTAASRAIPQKLDTLKTQASAVMARAVARAHALRTQTSQIQPAPHPPAAPGMGSTFDLDDLIDRVDSFRRLQELQILASLEQQNRRLREELARLHQRYAWTCNLLLEVRGALLGLEQTIRAFQNRRLQAQAEQPASRVIPRTSLAPGEDVQP